MEKTIALSESSPQMANIDEAKFLRFMHQTPIWEHFKMTQQVYLSLSTEEKTKMINSYVSMNNGKVMAFFVFDL